jgi:hypothetical protein
MVLFQSMSWCRGRLVRAARFSAPVTAWMVLARSRSSSSSGHLPDHRPGRLAGVLGDHPAEADQRTDKADVGLYCPQHLRLQEQLPQAQPVHGVRLHDLHHAGREVGPRMSPSQRDTRGLEAPRPPRRRCSSPYRSSRAWSRRLSAAESSTRLPFPSVTPSAPCPPSTSRQRPSRLRPLLSGSVTPPRPIRDTGPSSGPPARPRRGPVFRRFRPGRCRPSG